MARSGICVIGAGQAAAELAAALRQAGCAAKISLIGDETWLPYQRPPLSKGCLSGELPVEKLQLRTAEFYERNAISVRSGRTVLSVDLNAATLRLDDDQVLSFESLVFATGGRARPLDVPGAAQAGHCTNWFTLRNISDMHRLLAVWREGRHVAIVGGGYIGLEVAASAIKCGLTVTVLEGAPRVLARVTAPEMSAFYQQAHRDAGVDLRTGVQIRSVEVDDGRVVALDTSEGRIEAEMFVIGIGLLPNAELAKSAGLATENGIVVDTHLRTEHPNVFAIGDCAAHPNVWSGTRTRVESVPNAIEQARVVAANLTGKPRVHDALPWFWSEQFDLKLQMAGLSQGYDQIVLRGSPEQRAFTAFYLREGTVIAADTVSRAGEFLAAKKLVAARARVSADRLADESQPLKLLLET